MCFLGYFEYIYSHFSLVFHVSKVFLGISLSQMIFRSAENTFFLRRTFCICPHVVGKIGIGQYVGVLRGLVFLLDGSLFLSKSV